MPFHLPALSRREFLRRSVLAGAGYLALRSGVSAAETDPHRWALLSDTHIAEDPTTIAREVNLTKNLESVISQVSSLSARPAGLMINGDCALNRGLAGDYATLSKLIQPLSETGIPAHLLLGNHDDRDVFWTSLNAARPAQPLVDGRHLSILETPRANWFLLDSLDIVNKTPGQLGDQQRAWLAKELDARAGKPALVMLHHNPNPADGSKTTGLKDTSELLEILLPRKHVKMLFFGHSHTWRLSEQDGMHLVNLPAVAYRFKPEEVTGWVDCLLGERGATLEVRAHDTTHSEHGRKRELAWRAS